MSKSQEELCMEHFSFTQGQLNIAQLYSYVGERHHGIGIYDRWIFDSNLLRTLELSP